MPQFDRLPVLAKLAEQPLQPIGCFAGIAKTCRELEKDATQLTGFMQWCNSLLELIDVGRQPDVLLMGKFLPRLDGELETIRRTFGPAGGCFWSARPIERRINFDGIEISGIKLEFIAAAERIEDSRPGTRPAARRITPAAGADTPDGCDAKRTVLFGLLFAEEAAGQRQADFLPEGLGGSTGAVRGLGLSKIIRAIREMTTTASPTSTANVKLSMANYTCFRPVTR